ncbi:BatD family protein [Methanococcoides methylutens]|uniref:BatD family protein n=1 Tax=Methanococcoides methylutens TaxID=2226 RepID=UPI004044A8B0
MYLKRIALAALMLLFLTGTSSAVDDFQYEEIWVHQGVFDLATGDRASAEKYTVKLHEINEEDDGFSATLLLYINGEFQKSFFADASLNNEFVHDKDLTVRTLSIDGTKVTLELYLHEYELVWIPSEKWKLAVEDTAQVDNTIIKLLDVSDTVATMEVTIEGETYVDEYETNAHRKYSDDIMARVTYIDRNNKEINLQIYQPGEAGFKIEIRGLEEQYSPNMPASFEIYLKNIGTIPARGITITASASNGQLEPVRYDLAMLDTLKIHKIPVNLKLPETPVRENIIIDVKVDGYDYRGSNYRNSTTAQTVVEPYISIEKSVDTHLLTEEDKTKRKIIVDMVVYNNASIGHEVTIRDPIPSTFKPLGVESPEWTIFINAGRSENIRYKALPTVAGTYELGPAIASWYSQGETYSVGSKGATVTIDIEGALLEIEKDVSLSDVFTGEEVDVTVTITNIGMSDVEVSLTEDIPAGFKFVSGADSWEGQLEAGDKKRIAYTMLAKEEGIFELPPAIVSYTDEDEIQGTFGSNVVKLYVYSPGTTDMNIENENIKMDGEHFSRMGHASFLLSAFITIAGVLSIIPLIAYFYIRRSH